MPKIAAISLEIRSHAAEKTGVKALKFITSNLIPPPKRDVLAFLGVPLTTGEKPAAAPRSLDRRAGSDVSPCFSIARFLSYQLGS